MGSNVNVRFQSRIHFLAGPRVCTLEVDVGAKPGNDDRAAIAVKARVVDEGDLRGAIKAAEYVRGVVSLSRCFPPIVESAVPQHEADATQGEVLAVVAPEPTVHDGTPD